MVSKIESVLLTYFIFFCIGFSVIQLKSFTTHPNFIWYRSFISIWIHEKSLGLLWRKGSALVVFQLVFHLFLFSYL